MNFGSLAMFDLEKYFLIGPYVFPLELFSPYSSICLSYFFPFDYFPTQKFIISTLKVGWLSFRSNCLTESVTNLD